MVLRSDPNLTNTLTALHTLVVHPDKNVPGTLGKGVGEPESAGRVAHDKTPREIVDVLTVLTVPDGNGEGTAGLPDDGTARDNGSGAGSTYGSTGR